MIALVITGTDPAFCAGLDLKELSQSNDIVEENLFAEILALPQVTIAAVNGPAVAGGLELALVCDVRLASERATFADTHLRVGVIPGGGGSVFLARAIGAARAKEMSLTGNYVSAGQADQWGLVNRVVRHEDLLETALSLAQSIASSNHSMVRQMKSAIDEGFSLSVPEALECEQRRFQEFRSRFDPSVVAEQRKAVIKRGRAQARGISKPSS